MKYIILRVMDHIEVYDQYRRFIFSADTLREAERELRFIHNLSVRYP